MRDLALSIKKCTKEYDDICKELENMPEGRLVRRGNYFSQVIGNKNIVITKNIPLIKSLCRKKYLQARKKKLEQNLTATTRSRRLVDITPQLIIKELPTTYQNLPQNYFYHPTVEEFLAKEYPTNTYKSENKSYHSNSGIPLRSKSELIIANELEAYDIPYRYEYPIKMGTQIKYPDFTVMNPYTGKYIIWEHFGAFHKEGYEANMTQKMKAYLARGYKPFETIIYTFEFDTQTPGRIKELIETIILQ